MKTITVTGTPGTGKTALSKELAKKLDFYYLDVNRLISNYKLSDGYDKKRRTKIVDINKLNKKIINQLKSLKNINEYGGIIIDSHLSHYLPRKYVDLCIVTKCDIKELNKRLKKKKFSKDKIKENLQAEIFDVCCNEALGKKHKILAVNTTKGFNITTLARKVGD